jgi:hypothetical protein
MPGCTDDVEMREPTLRNIQHFDDERNALIAVSIKWLSITHNQPSHAPKEIELRRHFDQYFCSLSRPQDIPYTPFFILSPKREIPYNRRVAYTAAFDGRVRVGGRCLFQAAIKDRVRRVKAYLVTSRSSVMMTTQQAKNHAPIVSVGAGGRACVQPKQCIVINFCC